ncbi:tumor protein p53-inducible protein 13 isoform X1 [Notamacropus eugenii]|uniref:tumor protein p53-inducible protein 13 isoform X1 n=1 Tax=Notamacropus eugenii TaxID=9315 RepID=UPI003B67DC93
MGGARGRGGAWRIGAGPEARPAGPAPRRDSPGLGRGMAAPCWAQLLLLPLLLLPLLPALLCRATRGPRAVRIDLAQDNVRCPGELWPLPQEVSPRVTNTWMGPGQGSNITFLYHPCVHPWLKLQLALLAHVCVSRPILIPHLSLTQHRPLVLVAWGASLEMARVQPGWVAHWLKRRRRERRAWPTPSSAPWLPWAEPTQGKDRLCPGGSVQALATAFALRSWRPPGEGIKSWGPEYALGAKRRRLRAALGSGTTRAPPHSLGISKAVIDTPREAVDNPMLAIARRGGESNDSEPGHGSPGGCVCPRHPSPVPRAAPSRPARAPTPRTEEAAWAATALTFLLVLLTLATLCTRLHRNFRRGESIYWGPIADSQDTVAAVLKRRLLAAPRRPKRSRRRPLLPPGPGPDQDSLGPDGGGGDSDSSSD